MQGSLATVQFKPHLQKVLRRVGLYHRVQASPLYYLYWKVADSSLIEEESRELDFYRNLLRGFRQDDLIFDVGANHGSKTSIFLRLGARVVAVEPDDANRAILEEKFLKYRLIPKPVTIVNKAVSDTPAIETMWIDEPGSAKNTLSRKWVDVLRDNDDRFGYVLQFSKRKEVVTTTLEQLVRTHGRPFFIKIDVEGYELSVLRGMRQPVPYLSFEVNLPEFMTEGLQCVDLLRQLAVDGTFNYTPDCRKGFLLERWFRAHEFSRVLSKCTEKSIEVFWKTSLTGDK